MRLTCSSRGEGWVQGGMGARRADGRRQEEQRGGWAADLQQQQEGQGRVRAGGQGQDRAERVKQKNQHGVSLQVVRRQEDWRAGEIVEQGLDEERIASRCDADAPPHRRGRVMGQGVSNQCIRRKKYYCTHHAPVELLIGVTQRLKLCSQQHAIMG